MKRVLLSLIAALAIAFMAMYAVHAVFCLAYPHQLEYGEGLCMALTRRIIDAGTLYNDPSAKPWLICEYTPLFFLLCSVLSGGNLTFFIGRMVSFVSFLSVAGLIIFYCGRFGRCEGKKSGKSTEAVKKAGREFLYLGAGGWVAAALIFCDSVQAFWSVLFRIDLLGILFSFLGLFFADKICRRVYLGRRANFIHVLLSAICLTLAFFTKQSLVSALAASSITLLLINKKTAWEYISVCGILLGTGLLMLQMFFGDKFLFVMLNCTGMYWTFARFSEYSFSYWIWKLPLAVMAIFALKHLWPAEKLWCLYAVICFLTVPSVGRAGSYYNYFLEPCLALTVLAGLYANYLWKADNKHGQVFFNAALAAVLAQSALGFWTGFDGGAVSMEKLCRNEIVPVLTGSYPQDRACEKELMDEVMKAAAEIVLPDGSVKQARETEFVKIPVLAEDMGCFVAEGYEVWLVDPATYCDLEHMGIYDFSELDNLIANNYFALIEINDMYRSDRLPSSAIKSIKEHYRPARGIAGKKLFVPISAAFSENRR